MKKLIRAIAVTLIIIAVLAPIIPQLIWSFAFRWFFPDLLPGEWGLEAWRYVLSDSSRVGEGLLNSLAIATAVSLLTILIGLPAARALALAHFRGKELIEWLLLLPIIVPTIVVVMGIHILFIRYRLANTFLGVILVHLIPSLPYMILVMASVFANYGTELEDTARTLGANARQTFWYVTLPAIFPGLVVATLFTFLISWAQYITTLLIGGGRIITLPLVLFPFVRAADHATASAISLVFVVPALLVLIFTSRSLAVRASGLGGFGRL